MIKRGFSFQDTFKKTKEEKEELRKAKSAHKSFLKAKYNGKPGKNIN